MQAVPISKNMQAAQRKEIDFSGAFTFAGLLCQGKNPLTAFGWQKVRLALRTS
jgi:hypothetical protein